VNGHHERQGEISRRTSAVILSIRPGVEVTLHVEFYAVNGGNRYELGAEEFDAQYTLGEKVEEAHFLRATWMVDMGRPLSEAQYSSLVDLKSGPTEEDLMGYLFDSLKAMATGPDIAKKRWLRTYLSSKRDTPLVRELRALLK